jgi:hypothetical protein
MSSAKVENVERTSRGLAQAMFEELDLLRNGESTPQQARAKASVANTVCALSRVEMDFSRFVTENHKTIENDASGLKALPMG